MTERSPERESRSHSPIPQSLQRGIRDVLVRISNWITRGGRTQSTFVHTLLTYSKFCGLSPYYLEKECTRKTWMKGVLAGTVGVLGVGNIAFRSRNILSRLIGESNSSDVGQYMRICYDVSKTAMVGAVLLSLWKKVTKFQKAAFVLDTTSIGGKTSSIGNQFLNTIILLLGLLIAAVKTFHLFLDDPIYELHHHANVILEGLFLPPFNDTNTTTPPVAALGVLGTGIKFSGNLIEQLAFDAVLISSLTLAKCCKNFKFKNRSPVLLPSSVGVPTDTGTQIMNDYEELKKISRTVNNAIGPIFRCVLLTSMFMFAVYANLYFQKGIARVIRILWLIDLIKPLVLFYFALETSTSAERFQSWINEGTNKYQLGLSDTDFIVAHLSAPSIGLGEGALYVNLSFLLGYFGLIAAYFFGIVETRQPNCI